MTIKVPAVTRETIDNWPIPEAGLPARVVHCCARAGIRTVGELREWRAEDLMALRSFGVRSLRQTHAFFRLCRQLEADTLVFPNLKAVLGEFLLPAQLHVLARRYGLLRKDATAARDCETLQQIADGHRLTRERVRQTEAAGMARLRCRLPGICLGPLVEAGTSYLDAHGGAASAREVSEGLDAGLFSPYNPPGALLLAADILPGRIGFLNGLFTLTPSETLAAIEQRARAGLVAAGGPVDLIPLSERMGPPLLDELAPNRHAVLPRILTHMKDVLATRDGRFLLDDHADRLAADLLSARPEEPLHFEAITGLLNDCLDERSALSATQVLMRLSRSDVFERVDRGRYRLRGGTALIPPSP
jgi:hypothetical protein